MVIFARKVKKKNVAFRSNIARRQKVGGKVAEISYREEHCTGDIDHTSLRQEGLL